MPPAAISAQHLKQVIGTTVPPINITTFGAFLILSTISISAVVTLMGIRYLM
jgi:hypothetical protein